LRHPLLPSQRHRTQPNLASVVVVLDPVALVVPIPYFFVVEAKKERPGLLLLLLLACATAASQNRPFEK
jgi:hypothetical protein